jgi:hypothetical protein
VDRLTSDSHTTNRNGTDAHHPSVGEYPPDGAKPHQVLTPSSVSPLEQVEDEGGPVPNPAKIFLLDVVVGLHINNNISFVIPMWGGG